ncbi:MAG: outer membrane beta-barrel protein [bacterium]
MKTTAKLVAAASVLVLICAFESTMAQDKPEPKNSNIGLKLNLGLGSQDFTAAQELEEDGAASLNLGYGVSQRVTLWLGAQSGEFQHTNDAQFTSHWVGLEFDVQYKFRPEQKFRPYGKIGLGTAFLGNKETDIVLNGGGVTWALGAEYRLTRFLSVGGEFYWKDFEYRQQQVGEDDFKDLPSALEGDTRGFMLNFTLH